MTISGARLAWQQTHGASISVGSGPLMRALYGVGPGAVQRVCLETRSVSSCCVISPPAAGRFLASCESKPTQPRRGTAAGGLPCGVSPSPVLSESPRPAPRAALRCAWLASLSPRRARTHGEGARPLSFPRGGASSASPRWSLCFSSTVSRSCPSPGISPPPLCCGSTTARARSTPTRSTLPPSWPRPCP